MGKFLIGLVFGAVAGVGGSFLVAYLLLFQPPPALPANSYGRFVGELDPIWLDDGRSMKLKSDFAFIDPFMKAWVSPAGSVVDGASIPKSLWSIVGGPYEGQYRVASVVHDVACQDKKEPSEDVHRMFYYACRCAGVEENTAKAMYLAVLKGGPQWKLVREIRMIDGQPLVVGKAIDVSVGEELDEQEIAAAMQYIETHSPDLPTVATLQFSKDSPITASPPE